MKFIDFKIGDYIFFSKKFTQAEYKNFKELSGDSNELHHNNKYAEHTIFKKPILPLHMACLPFSRIAGVHFPGQPSLYLQHSIKAIKPTFYDEELIYSAVIKEINYSLRVIELSILVIRNELEVAIEGLIHVQSRDDSWTESSKKFIKKSKNIFVLGLSQSMIDPIFSRFLKKGWIIYSAVSSSFDLTLIDKWAEKYPSQIKITNSFNECDSQIINRISGDICLDPISAVLTINEPGIDNYYIFKSVLDKFLPKFLKEQNGRIINLSDSMGINDDDYKIDCELIAYQMEKIKKYYSKYGIFCQNLHINLCEDFDMEEFSEFLESQLANELVKESSISNSIKGAPFVDENLTINQTSDQKNEIQVEIEIKKLIMKLFNLPKNYPWKLEGLGITPGWDSFGHILLLLEVEKKMGIKFLSGEYEGAYEFQKLVDLALSRYRGLSEFS